MTDVCGWFPADYKADAMIFEGSDVVLVSQQPHAAFI